MTYLPITRLDEIAADVLPKLLDGCAVIHRKPHILRVTGLLPGRYPYTAKVNIVADPVGGLWFTIEIENFYGIGDRHAETLHTRLANLDNADLLRQLRHLLRALLAEVDLQPAPPGLTDRNEIKAWLHANTRADEKNIEGFLNRYFPQTSDR